MDNRGKIVVNSSDSKMYIVIANIDKCCYGLELSMEKDTREKVKLSIDDVVADNDNRSLLDDKYVVTEKSCILLKEDVTAIFNLTEKGYLSVLRSYISYQSSIGGKDGSYLSVRNDLHDQFIELSSKVIGQ